MAHGEARVGKWRGNWRMERVASTLHTTSEHGVSNITTADAHTSAASSRLNWRPFRFEWTRPFHRKTKSDFFACAVTFPKQSTYLSSPSVLACHVKGRTLHLHSQIEVRRNSSMHSRRAQFGWRRQTHLLSDLTPKQEHPLDVGEETNWKFENSEQENVHSWSSMNRETVRTSSTVPCFFFGPVLEGWDPSALQSNEWGVSHITDTAVKKERCSQSDCSAPTPNITNQISYIIKAMICILFCMSAEITIALREEHKLRLQMKKFMSSSSSSSSYSSSSR